MRPSNLLYALDERPPIIVTVLSAMQHAAIVVSIGAVFPLLVLNAAGASAEQVRDTLAISMVVLGLTTILQCWKRIPLGSGFLLPAVFTAAYLPASLAAARTGGLPLVFGMTLFAGLIEMALSRALHRLRPYLPPEIAGFAVAMIGIVLGILGFRLMFGVDVSGRGPVAVDQGMVAAGLVLGGVTLAVMIGLNVWSKGRIRLFCALVGLVVGYAVAVPMGLLDVDRIVSGLDRPLLSMPLPYMGLPTFQLDLALPFAVGALACVLRAIGDITTCQKINDTDWQHPDIGSIRRGVLVDGIGTTLAGLLGTVGQNTFSGSVGLSVATGITARVVGVALGFVLVGLAFLPSMLDVLAVMPKPVMGASLIFSGCYIIVNGLQVIFARMLDARKIFVIGIPLLLGLSRDIFPAFFEQAPVALQPLVSSSLVLGITVALLLNLLFRLNVHRRMEVSVAVNAEGTARLIETLERQGGEWGARRDVWTRVQSAVAESVDLARQLALPGSAVTLSVAFDEYRVDAQIGYVGQALERTTALPDHDDLMASGAAVVRLGSYLLARMVDRLETATENGPLGATQFIRLRFEH